MPEDILGLDEAKRMVKEYVFKIETEAYLADDNEVTSASEVLPKYVEVEIRGTEPSSRDKSESVVHGCVRRHVVGTPTRDIVIAERTFRLWISRIDGEIRDYLPEDWGKSEGQRIPQDEELRESEIRRNLLEAENFEEEMEERERDRQERDESSDPLKKYRIDINKFRFRM